MDAIIQNVMDNLSTIIVVLLGLLGFISKNSKIINNVLGTVGSKAEKVDVESVKETQKRLESMLAEMLAFQEVYADFQSQHSNVLPTEYKERYKDILDKYRG